MQLTFCQLSPSSLKQRTFETRKERYLCKILLWTNQRWIYFFLKNVEATGGSIWERNAEAWTATWFKTAVSLIGQLPLGPVDTGKDRSVYKPAHLWSWKKAFLSKKLAERGAHSWSDIYDIQWSRIMSCLSWNSCSVRAAAFYHKRLWYFILVQ